MDSPGHGSGIVPVLVVTGTVGVGKSTVAGAISARLDRGGVAHAMVDLDHLRWRYPRDAADPYRIGLGLRNLAAVWANYRASGAERLVIADVVEAPGDVAGYRRAIPGAEVVVVRLEASPPVVARRLAGRETEATIGWYLRRAAELAELMRRREVGGVVIETGSVGPAVIAGDVLRLVGWPMGSGAG